MSGRPFFINRDPIEEAGGFNLYGFCGNDGINGFDPMGNSWFSHLWDNSVGWLGKKVAQDWNDGGRTAVEAIGATITFGAAGGLWVFDPDARPYIDMAAAIAASVLTYGVVDTWAAGAIGSTFGVATTSTFATVGGGIIGGAAGGFVSGMSLGEMQGQGLSRAFDDGLEGAESARLKGELPLGKEC